MSSIIPDTGLVPDDMEYGRHSAWGHRSGKIDVYNYADIWEYLTEQYEGRHREENIAELGHVVFWSPYTEQFMSMDDDGFSYYL